jgi:hypothetical protein
MYKKLLVLVTLLLVGCGAGSDSSSWLSSRPSLSGPMPTCPGPGEIPKPLPTVRTIEQLAEYATEMDIARQKAEYARTMCARELQKLANRIHWE